MLNNTTFMGRLTREVELRQTTTGKNVANFTVAVDDDFGTGDTKHTNFINCTAWNKTAEFVSKYFNKGSLIVVNGRLTEESFTDRDGNNRSRIIVTAEKIYFGGSKGSGGATQEEAPAPTWEEMTDGEDLPF